MKFRKIYFAAFSLTFSLIFLTQLGFAQDSILFKKRLKFKQVEALEKALKSVPKGTTPFNITKDLITGQETKVQYSPYLFERTNDSFEPKLFTWYFFKKDSVIEVIYYNWGIYNPSFHPQKGLDKLNRYSEQIDLFENKYRDVKEKLTVLMGESKSVKETDNSQKKNVETIWENDFCKVLLLMIFFKEVDNVPGMGSMANYAIRIELFYK